MTVEIEAKMRLHDRPALRAALEAAATSDPVEIFEVNTYYDTPGHELKIGDKGLRLRVEQTTGGEVNQRVLITYKGPRAHGPLKSRREIEFTVSDADAAEQLLTELGYERVITFEKHRQRWQIDGCHVDVDTLPRLGEFVEVEGPDEDAVLAVRKRLGLESTPIVHSSYLAMLVSHLAENDGGTQYLGFEEETGAAKGT